jgi:transmembrane sensor
LRKWIVWKMALRNQEIDRIAADWVTRRDLGALSSEEEAAFQDWLSADARHLGAYGRAEAVLLRLERLNVTALDELPADSSDQSGWNRRRLMLAGGTAAGIAAGVGLALYRLESGPERKTYSTAIGQIQEVVLADGSIVLLNTNTKIVVRFTDKLRDIALLQGEAQFDVVKNKMRPFIVSAGGTRVRAVGTSFTVTVLPNRPIQVLVKEGVVELRRADAATAIPVRASANIQAIAPEDAPIVTVAVPEQKLVRDLAWQHGRIALDNQSLEDAADEFARYSEVHIVVDPAVSDRTNTGLFASNDPVAFAKAAAAVLKLKVEVRGDEVRIF